MIIATFFFAGIACVTFAIAGLFFLKFWKASQDRFFKFLCTACWILSLERIVGLIVYLIDPSDDFQTTSRAWLYLIRLVAFIVILVGVIQKNRSLDTRH